MEIQKKKFKMKKLILVPSPLTQYLNFMRIGLQEIIEIPMEFLRQMEFYLIMNHREEVKHL